MSAYARELGARLRAVRLQKGLSLHRVEERSGGRWKAVVVGSYERGDRAVTVQRLAELADFYGVPVRRLLPGRPGPERRAPGAGSRLVIDLERLSAVEEREAGVVRRLASAIQDRRGDWNGRVLSLRADDVEMLAVLYDVSPPELVERLAGWGVTAAVGGSEEPEE